jgi:glycosyltransferase involved in cell wall biosynthesis
MQRLKIAIVANSCWNIYNFRKELIRHFKMTGHQVIVIAPVDEYIHYLNESYFTKHIDIHHLDSLKLTPLKDVLFFRELYQIYKREKPDLIFHFTIKPNIYGSIAAKLLGIKCISTLTGLGYSFSKLKYRLVFNSIYKWALSKNEKVAFHNSDDLNLFINKKWITSDKGIVIPGSGVDTNVFNPQTISDKNEKFVFLFAGRLLKDKGLEEFVAAAIEARSIIKNAEFWIIGEYNTSNKNSISKKVDPVEGDQVFRTGTRCKKISGKSGCVCIAFLPGRNVPRHSRSNVYGKTNHNN